MTDIEAEARRRFNEAWGEQCYSPRATRKTHPTIEAMCRLLEEFEAYKREVSDAVEAYMLDPQSVTGPASTLHLRRFILPTPVDPLVEALNEISGEGGCENMDFYAYRIRAALAARGLEIREKAGE